MNDGSADPMLRSAVGPILAAASSSFQVPGWVVYIVLPLVGLILALVAWPAIKTQRAKATIDLQDSEIETRDRANTWLHAEMTRLEQRCKDREQEMETRHAREIAQLNGRLDGLTSDFAKSVAVHVAQFLREGGIDHHGV